MKPAKSALKSVSPKRQKGPVTIVTSQNTQNTKRTYINTINTRRSNRENSPPHHTNNSHKSPTLNTLTTGRTLSDRRQMEMEKFAGRVLSGSPNKNINSASVAYIQSARKHLQTIENLDPGVPSQNVVEDNMRACAQVMKDLLRETDARLKEKKTLQIVVDQLKQEILLEKSKLGKDGISHQKWENQAIRVQDDTNFKENQRIVNEETKEKLKDELAYMDHMIQDEVRQNTDMVFKINKEKEYIKKMQRKVDKLKRFITITNKDKELLKNNITSNIKLAPVLEDRIKDLVKEKEEFAKEVQKVTMKAMEDK